MEEFLEKRRGMLATGMVQPSQQHVVPCVKVVEWGFDTRGLRMFPVEVTQETGVVSRL